MDKEEAEALAGKKKGFVKKRRMIEERLLVEGEPLEEEARVEKEGEPSLKPFRPVRKKLVVRESKKTEVTVPKAIKRIIRIAEMITVGRPCETDGCQGRRIDQKTDGHGDSR